MCVCMGLEGEAVKLPIGYLFPSLWNGSLQTVSDHLPFC